MTESISLASKRALNEELANVISSLENQILNLENQVHTTNKRKAIIQSTTEKYTEEIRELRAKNEEIQKNTDRLIKDNKYAFDERMILQDVSLRNQNFLKQGEQVKLSKKIDPKEFQTCKELNHKLTFLLSQSEICRKDLAAAKAQNEYLKHRLHPKVLDEIHKQFPSKHRDVQLGQNLLSTPNEEEWDEDELD